jgi:hypothetical protein
MVKALRTCVHTECRHICQDSATLMIKSSYVLRGSFSLRRASAELWQGEKQLVFDVVADQPGFSTRGLSGHSMCGLHSLGTDNIACSVLGKVNEDADFNTRVPWTDDWRFTQMGIVNTHTTYITGLRKTRIL